MSYNVLDVETGKLWGVSELKRFRTREEAQAAILSVSEFEHSHGIWKHYEVMPGGFLDVGEQEQ